MTDVMLLLVTVILSVVVGIALAVCHARTKIRVVAFIAVFLVSNLLNAWPYFTDDAATWATTYFSGAFMTGAASILFHVLPAVVAYYLAAWVGKKVRKSGTP